MALGAMVEHPQLEIAIVPVGLNYFHADKFRSRAVIEYGPPIYFDKSLVSKYAEGGAAKHKAIETGLSMILKSLRELTLTAPDYERLTVLHPDILITTS
jgi:glycerol-3-phosphate O-acyltransferase/dihydroxyacetone phosphate acyltransferase